MRYEVGTSLKGSAYDSMRERASEDVKPGGTAGLRIFILSQHLLGQDFFIVSTNRIIIFYERRQLLCQTQKYLTKHT